jgi:hypothetical protein
VTDQATPADFIAAIADRYRIERTLGRGGMATVYLARDLRHGRHVAVKQLDPALGAAIGAERFEVEIRVTAALQHPHLLPLFDSGVAAGSLYYVTPFIEGHTLRARMERERQLPIAEALRLTRIIADALQFAHDRGVVHRDLKPENILFQGDQPIVADFGIALAASAPDGRLTQTGLALGTPLYMSPEQATGERRLDARSDQFALATLVYEMLTGEVPHAGSTVGAVLGRLLSETPRAAHAVRPSVPPAVSDAVGRALAKTPDDRFPSVRAFADALTAATAVATPASGTPGRAWPSTTRGVVFGVAALALVAAGVWRARTPSPSASARSRDPRGVLIAHTAVPADSAVARLVDDALAERLAQLPWVAAHTSPSALTDERDALGVAAGSVGATFIALTTLARTADGAQLRMRLIDATTGALLRTTNTALPQGATSMSSLRTAVEPLAAAAGMATAPVLGPETIPAGALPTLASLRDLTTALSSIDGIATSVERRARVRELLSRAIAADTAFLQARLWLAWVWTNDFARIRGVGGSGLADTVVRWSLEAETTGSRYEVALGRVARSNISENGDAILDPIRDLLRLDPDSPLHPVLPQRLLGLNRAHEALRVKYAHWRSHGAADSLQPQRQAEFWNGVAHDWHYVGRFDSALVAARRARALRPTAGYFLSTELQQLAALGWLDSLDARIVQVEGATQDGFTFGYPGDTYLTIANELEAHGSAAAARALLERARSWFERHAADAEGNSGMQLRWALTLMALNRAAEAEELLREALARSPSDTRLHGAHGRTLVDLGRLAEADRELDWLRDMARAAQQGQPTYERATIMVHRGRASWDDALGLLEEAIRDGQDYTLLRRLHAFGDWQPLRDVPRFRRLITPVDAPAP